MPVATPKQYNQMLNNAHKNGFAYPAINVATIEQANAVLAAFAELKTDGIIQVSTGGAKFASGSALNDMVIGAISLAQHVHLVAEKYDVLVALHTDHCQPDKVDSFLRPLIAESRKRVEKGMLPLFNSHMFDGSSIPLKENMDVSVELLKECTELNIILEVEAGVVGGEEDGVSNENAPAEKLYTTPEDMVEVYRRLSTVDNARYLFAATFGNVHGVYKPGNVKLRPVILKEGQDAVVKEFGEEAKFQLVFHGGSGSSLEEIRETLDYGVVKMNVDTDTQYAFTRPIADHMLKNYDGVLKIEGEVGNKKVYDPRSYMKKAEASMKDRVKQAVYDLRGENSTLFSK